jgi:hypothetical protein
MVFSKPSIVRATRSGGFGHGVKEEMIDAFAKKSQPLFERFSYTKAT